MRESMARLTPMFSGSRAVREYTEQHYLPSAEAYLRRAADHGALGRQVVEWQRTLKRKWAALRFGKMEVQTDGSQHVLRAEVFLADLDPAAVRVELFADGIHGGEPVRQAMTQAGTVPGPEGGRVYEARVSADRPAADYTARIVPCCDGVAVPLENMRILWQR